MRKGLIIGLLLFLSSYMIAQVRTGNIYGRVVDNEGNPLPGATITLSGSQIAAMTSISGQKGEFRFISLPPANDYVIRAELQGFSTQEFQDIVVSIGANVELRLELKVGVIQEEITVTADTPVVDTKQTSAGQVVTHEALQNLPTARDPWEILTYAPGVVTGRVNVGGSESGAQNVGEARGNPGTQGKANSFSMDGVPIQDTVSGAVIGGTSYTPTYFDFDAFEEMVVVTGGANVTSQTGGLALNMVTRRGGNRISLSGRYYVTDNYFQANNLTDELRAEGVVGINKINNIKDYGFNLGGPIIRDKTWFWMSFGVQDIKTDNIYGKPIDTLLTTYVGKLNFQIMPQNRLELFVHANNKEMWGAGSSATLPQGRKQEAKYHFGFPIVKIQNEHMFGDSLLVSFKFASVMGGSKFLPMNDPEWEILPYFNVEKQVWENSSWKDEESRPHNQVQFLANYFTDLFGASHEFNIGAEYSHRGVDWWRAYSAGGFVNYSYNYPTVDYTGDGSPDVYPGIMRLEFNRRYNYATRSGGWSVFLSDLIAIGRFNVIAGLRFDHQYPEVNENNILALNKDNPALISNSNPSTINAIDQLLPAIETPRVTPLAADGSNYYWNTLSPRIGLNWDLTGDGKTIAKIFAASYGDYMGGNFSGYWRPGGTSGWMDFWWLDANNNRIFEVSELYWHKLDDYGLYRVFDDAGNFIGDLDDASGVMYGGYDPRNPLQTQDPYTLFDKNATSSRTRELLFSVEREIIRDFGVTLNMTYRIYDKMIQNHMYYPDSGEIESEVWYMSAGKPPASIPGLGDTKGAKNHEWYVLKEGYDYTPWSIWMPRDDYYGEFFGIDLVFNKRLSNKWMFNGSFSYMNQKSYYGDDGLINKTNLWALEGRPENSQSPRWMFKGGALYQFPYDFNLSCTFNIREGWKIRESFMIVDYSLPNPRSNSARIYMEPYGTEMLSPLANISLRLEKVLRIEAGNIHLMADIFNVFNSSVIQNRYDKDHGTYYVHLDQFVPNPNSFRASRILNSRVARFGVRFEF